MKRSPLITVITATHNAARHLPRAIEAMRAQTYGNAEWVIVDGASTDGTVDLIRANADIVDQWVTESDVGIYDAWNKGLLLARGQWICFLGADDWLWEPDVLNRFAGVLERAYPPFRVVYGRVAMVNYAGEILYVAGTPWKNVRKRFQSIMSLPHPGLMHHRSLFDEHGCFDASFRIAGDYEFLLRELRSSGALFVPDILTAGMLRNGMSSSVENFGVRLREIRRATRKNGYWFPGGPWMLSTAYYLVMLALCQTLGERAGLRVLDVGRRLMGKPAYWTKINEP